MVYQKVGTKAKEVYGITGAKGHGKDTLAKLITNSGRQGAGFQVVHFADALKRLCMEVFGVSEYDAYDPLGKETPFPVPIVIDGGLEALKRLTGLPIRPHGLVARSPRELLQLVGTEYIRSEKDSHWIERLGSLLKLSRRVLVPDTRFPNEAEIIREHGGKIIRVLRVDAVVDTDNHSSETESTAIKADLTIGVRTGDLSLVERVAHLISKGRWDSAMRYDYYRIQHALALYQSAKPLRECVGAIGVKSEDSQAFRCILSYYGVPWRKPGIVSNPHRFEGDTEQKECRRCHTWKPLNGFSRNAKTWDLLHCICKPCASADHKQRYAQYEKEISLKELFRQAKQGARLRNLSFEITQEDLQYLWVKQEQRCFYTEENMVFTKGEPNKVSVDRLDSSVGYTPTNIVLCGSRVNLMKGPLSVQQFKKLIESVHDNKDKWASWPA